MNISKQKFKLSIKLLIYIIIIYLIYTYLYYNYSIKIPCLFHEMSNLYCPGCGITRMIISICKLDFYQAFRYNPLLFILMPFFVIYGIIYYINWLNDKKTIINKKVWNILLIIIILYMILRNIPYFSFLVPTIIK